MAKQIEISYYNSFVLTGPNDTGYWHVEESRIKGDFNGTSTDYGARAYMVDEDYAINRRANTMIHSDIYNSKTDTNNTNQFSIAKSITKSVDATNGAIQLLHSEDTNLNIFQEHKVSRALIDKDAIFTAEGTSLGISKDSVIGQISAYAGKFGISDNPESFAVFANRKYFVDKNRAAVLRLSQNGLEEISNQGMGAFFRDNLEKTRINTAGGAEKGRVYGMYDERFGQYIVSLQHSELKGGKKSQSNSAATTDENGFLTLGYSERSKGWVSFYSYKPTFGFSMLNQFFTFNDVNLYRHYDSAVYNNFYESTYNDPSYVTFVMNDSPSDIKTFMTISYEGTEDWSMDRAEAESVSKPGSNYSKQRELAYKIPKKGVTILDADGVSIDVGFELKESKYYKELKQEVLHLTSDYNATFNRNTLNTTLGIKGYHLEVDMLYHEATGNGKKVELYAVSNQVKV